MSEANGETHVSFHFACCGRLRRGEESPNRATRVHIGETRHAASGRAVTVGSVTQSGMVELPTSERPRVLLDTELGCCHAALDTLLEAMGIETQKPPCGVGLGEFATGLARVPDLFVVRVDSGDPLSLERLREIRATPWLRLRPILGVAPFVKLGLDLQLLRSYGIVGLVDPTAGPAALAQRIEQMVLSTSNRRACERVDCLFPVALNWDQRSSDEWALNLSASGLRLTTSERLELNTILQLRFRLPLVADDTIEADARLVRRLMRQTSCGRDEVAVVFYALNPRHREIIELEVARLLAP